MAVRDSYAWDGVSWVRKEVLSQEYTNMVPVPAISASHKTLLEMQIIQSYLKTTESEFLGAPEIYQILQVILMPLWEPLF